MLHGLHRVKAITDTPSSLHAVGIAGVKSMPIIQRLVHEYNQAKVALSDASAQGFPAHKYKDLKHTYKEKEDLNVCALRGSLFGGVGPAAAVRELSQQLQAGGDTNDNDSSDQAGSSTMHQASTSCVPLGSHLDSHTSDQGNADLSYEWMHQAASIPFLSQAPLSFASTSTPLSSTADDPAHTSSPASGTSLSAEEPLSLLLCKKCHGSECTGSKKALGSYGRSIGVRDQADPQRSRPWPMDEEMLEKAWSECNLHGECSLRGDHGHGGPGRMHGDPSTATRRTELKEHADGYHSGTRETRVKGTVTGQRRKSSVRDRDRQTGPEVEEQCRRGRHIAQGGQGRC
ncbi:uncharacterized protein UHOD_11406 [Ustilago sp. UG-2017b]|nr:uncharacterized protein UHOD_11406 [Ustilago sp. UG-2017b]